MLVAEPDRAAPARIARSVRAHSDQASTETTLPAAMRTGDAAQLRLEVQPECLQRDADGDQSERRAVRVRSSPG